MIYRNGFFAVVLVLVGLAYAMPAYPVGLGAYVTGSGGKAWHKAGALKEADAYGLRGRYMKDYPSVAYGAGLLLDSDPDSDGVFNYRLSIGYDRMNVLAGNRIDLNRINFMNTFGFRLYRNDAFKLWFGPQIGIDYWWGNEAHNTCDINPYMTMMPGLAIPPVSFRRRYRMVGFAGGLALGMNFNLTNSVTLSLEAGARGHVTSSLKELEGNPPSGKVNGVEGFLSFGVMGRVN